MLSRRVDLGQLDGELIAVDGACARAARPVFTAPDCAALIVAGACCALATTAGAQ